MVKALEELKASSPAAPGQEARRLVELPLFADEIQSISNACGRPIEEVTDECIDRLSEMVAVDSKIYTWLFDNVMGPAHTQAFTLDADTEALARLRRLGRKHPLVFLPSHRSYADVFVTAKALRANRLKRTHPLGGDNLKFFPFAQIAQHSGGVFIRRSFKDDDVYKRMLRTYLTYLISCGENLEWYMEGGRSRTGKLRAPKFGLMNYLVSAIKNGAADDVILVPTAITYDQLHEVRAMALQEFEGSKPKEGLAWLTDYVKSQRRWIGQVHLRFGAPLSLAERLKEAEQEPESARFLVEKTALEVFRQINLATPVTAQGFVTLALLAAGDRAQTLSELYDQIQPLLDYVEARKLPTSHVSGLRDEDGMLETLETLVESGVVEEYNQGTESIFRIKAGQHSVAAFYRNSAVHWFINRSILELAMWKSAHSGANDLIRAGKHETLALRDLLKFEFIFTDRAGFKTELLEESDLFDPQWRDRIATAKMRIEMITEAPFLISHTVLPTFLESYFLLADRLAAIPAEQQVVKNNLVDNCLNVGRQYLLQQTLRHPESLSRELFGNALKLAKNRDLLNSCADDIADRRQTFRAECEAAMLSMRSLERVAYKRIITS